MHRDVLACAPFVCFTTSQLERGQPVGNAVREVGFPCRVDLRRLHALRRKNLATEHRFVARLSNQPVSDRLQRAVVILAAPQSAREIGPPGVVERRPLGRSPVAGGRLLPTPHGRVRVAPQAMERRMFSDESFGRAYVEQCSLQASLPSFETGTLRKQASPAGGSPEPRRALPRARPRLIEVLLHVSDQPQRVVEQPPPPGFGRAARCSRASAPSPIQTASASSVMG